MERLRRPASSPAAPRTVAPLRRFRRWIPWLGIATATLALAPAVLAASPLIGIVDRAFDPTTTTITAGDTVTWENRGAIQHTVTADDGSFDSGPLDPGNRFANTFDKPGTYTYHCSIHSSMKGSVVVLEAPVTPTPATQLPSPPPGTLPPGFSPRPIGAPTPSASPASTPVPAPSPATSGGDSGGTAALAVGGLVLVGGGALLLLVRSRRARG